MTKRELNNRYFDWMYQKVCGKKLLTLSYKKLLSALHEKEFTYTIPMDGNRYEDGIDLRYRFGYENDYDQAVISLYLDKRSCSVLEMMVALAVRCEEHIMDNPNIGDRTGQWFWNMIVSLGLGSMNDEDFDWEQTNYILERFLSRNYEPNGKGGLFTVNCGRDLRTVDIWYQMCWYLNTV